MRAFCAAFLIALSSTASPALADVLIDDIAGVTLDEDGRIATFEALLIGEDGRIEQVFSRNDKRPGKVDYRLDGRGRAVLPGLIDSHVALMDYGFTLLAQEADAEIAPGARPRPEDRDRAFALAQEALIARGITAVADMGTTIEDWQTYRRAGDAGRLRLRVIGYAVDVAAMELIGGPGPSPWLYDDRLKMNGVVLSLDGPLEARAAHLSAPYADAPGSKGSPRLTDIQLRNLMSRGAIDNFQVAVEAHGDAAVESVLTAIDELSPTYVGERRWRLEGATVLGEGQAARLAQGGVIVSGQVQELPGRTAMIEARLGPDRAAQAQPWNSVAEAGAGLVFGSGAPKAPPQPFTGMAAALSRADGQGQPFGGWQPLQRLAREEALAAYTSAAAQALYAEGRLGRIMKGARADFLLLDRDPLLAGPEALAETRVLEVWIGGAKVFDVQAGAEDEANPFEGR